MSGVLRYFTSALSGPAQARAAHRQALLRHPSIVEGIAQLQRTLPVTTTDDDEPIFLLSAGWRSGSTLLQRLIMSDSRVLIWGEPYDECGMIQALAATMTAFRVDWPPSAYFYNGKPPDDLSGEWIANLFPSLGELRDGHRALFHATFAQPALRAGASRWGIKEVRLGIEHAAYLRWLYPRSRLIFLYRDPLSAFRSYSRHGRSWYDTFPDKPMFTASAFGSHWRRLLTGFLQRAEQFEALVLRYEDLVGSSPPIDQIERHLDIRVDRAVLEDKVGSSEGRGAKVAVSRLDKWLLRRAVSPLAMQVGYNCK